MGQIPKVWRTIPAPGFHMQPIKREWILRSDGANGFEQIIRSLIPLHIPVIYLEGYKPLQQIIEKVRWPKTPKLIFTSNSFLSDDVFKCWAASKVETGSKLIIGQHGGTYGAAQWVFTEDHQISISDKWISWGWKDDKESRIIPFGNLKAIRHKQTWKKNGIALMVSTTVPRYSYHMYSIPVASQWLDYFNEQCCFVAALPQYIQDQLLIRLGKQDYNWCQKERWHDKFPSVKLDNGRSKISSLVEQAKIFISTYNATTFLESFSWNMPTIIYWDPRFWELRAQAVPYFEILKKAGIFYDDAELAAQKVIAIWNDVPGWWDQPSVQEARRTFCDEYSRSVQNPSKNLKNILSSQ